MEKDVAEKQESSQDFQALRDENRRLYELVERLIATQESEQTHRDAIEAEIQEMKLALVEKSSGGAADDTADAPDLSAKFEQLLNDFGAGLEDKLKARIEAAEERLTAHSENHGNALQENPEASDKLANATWKMIAPLGDELGRLSGMIEDLGKRLDQMGEDTKQSSLALTKQVESAFAAARQANEELLARREEEAERSVPVDAFTRSLEAVEARQSEMQETAVNHFSSLSDAQAERLRNEWASQLADVKNALAELTAKKAARDAEAACDPAVREAGPAADDQKQDRRDAPQNVVAGDFPAFQRSTSDAAEPKTLDMTRKLRSDAMQTDGISPTTAETDTIERTGDLTDAQDDLASDDLASGARDPDDGDSEDRDSELEPEDALLTEPADWRTALDMEEEALVLTHPIIPERSETPADMPGDQKPELRSEPPSEDAGPRKVDLRAFKDLRLSSGPDGEEDLPDLREPAVRESPDQKGGPYENAPAEASLTRFVRLIRSRKRSSPS